MVFQWEIVSRSETQLKEVIGMNYLWTKVKPFVAAAAFYFGVRFVVETSVQNVAKDAICAFITEGAGKAQEVQPTVAFSKPKPKTKK